MFIYIYADSFLIINEKLCKAGKQKMKVYSQ